MYQLWDTNIFIGLANGQYTMPKKLNLPVAVSPATIIEVVTGKKSSASRRLKTLQKILKYAPVILPDSSFHIRLLFGKESLEEGGKRSYRTEQILRFALRNSSFEGLEEFVDALEKRRQAAESGLQAITRDSFRQIDDIHKIRGGDKKKLAHELLNSPGVTHREILSIINLLEGRTLGKDESVSTELMNRIYAALEIYLSVYLKYVEEEGTKKQGVFDPDAHDFGDLMQLVYIQPGTVWVTDEKKWYRYAQGLGIKGRVISGKDALVHKNR